MELVRNIDRNRARQVIVRNLVSLCADLGIEVIAEGVETGAERDFLLDSGIHLMQGYLLGRPEFQPLTAT